MQCNYVVVDDMNKNFSLHGYMTTQKDVYTFLLNDWRNDNDETDEVQAWNIDLRKMECDGTSDATLWAKRPFEGKWHLGNWPIV
ncbi:MAG: hypothetical protein DRP42_04845 [Tenericutes bacterium]|nr:MAG: hypothetical protein DRP42_04845 [Mycoplasmatota bacterium]